MLHPVVASSILPPFAGSQGRVPELRSSAIAATPQAAAGGVGDIHPRRDGAPEAVGQLFALAEAKQIDEAIDYAARVHRATVGEFVAAPSPIGAAGLPWVELAIEFFVPPESVAALATDVDRALTRRSMEYAAARRSDQVGPVRVAVVPPATFHQWRVAWRIAPADTRAGRWSADRAVLESVLHQARTGWREA
ncbi:MAG: GH3 auxin-responsive promoter family protein [Phycisphaerae bacterium]|nr:GH3 auxin-responsive promoter family protein [Tepidisphaeraceae bacterium]